MNFVISLNAPQPPPYRYSSLMSILGQNPSQCCYLQIQPNLNVPQFRCCSVISLCMPLIASRQFSPCPSSTTSTSPIHLLVQCLCLLAIFKSTLACNGRGRRVIASTDHNFGSIRRDAITENKPES